MDPRIAWCTPEQLGPAYKHWLRIWESSRTTPGLENKNCFIYYQHGGEMVENQNSDPNRINFGRQEDFIPLNWETAKSVSRRSGIHRNPSIHGPNASDVNNLNVNIASTYELNHSKNLEILENHRYIPWVIADKKYPEHTIMCLHEEIKDFYDYMHPTPAEQHMRHMVVDSIRDIVYSLWPEAKVEVFGSFETNLYLPTSDIDLVVFGKWPDIPLHTLSTELVKQGVAEVESMKVLEKATVPIIKLVDRRTKVKVDISFNQVYGVHSVKIIKEFLQLYPNLKYLVIVLKQYLLQRDLNEVYTGGIGSYCLIYLVISFLQMHETYDARQPEWNLAVLLIEFFELYGHKFNYHNVGIRIQNGGSYVPKQQLCELSSNGTVPSYLYIEDPANTANDIGKGSYGAYKVKEAFGHAYSVLCRSTGDFTHGNSVLSRIVRVTDKVLEYRYWISVNFQAPASPCHLLSAEDMPSPEQLTCTPAAVLSSTHSPSTAPSGKSYARAAASSLTKRSIASGSHCQRSGGESDCPTDISSPSPLSTTSASASSSSSIASDSDNENLPHLSVKIEIPKKATPNRRIHKTVTISMLPHKPAETGKSASSHSVSCNHSGGSNHNGGSHHSGGSNHSGGSKHSGSSSYVKTSGSKHPFSMVVHNSNSKQLTDKQTIDKQTAGSSLAAAAHTKVSASPNTRIHSSTQVHNKHHHKQTFSKRRKTNSQSAAINKGSEDSVSR